jgi:AcrR family transcriptional regulator
VDAAARILAAADQLFGEQGFDATTTREIAEQAGVNKALIHYHFKSKDELLARLLDRYYERLSGVLHQALSRDEGDLRVQFCDLIDAYLDFLVANRNFSRIVQREATGGRHISIIEQYMPTVFARIMVAIEARFPASVGSDLDPANVLLSFHGMIIELVNYGTVLQQLLGEDPIAPSLVERRRRHLHVMVDLTISAIERLEPVSPGPS